MFLYRCCISTFQTAPLDCESFLALIIVAEESKLLLTSMSLSFNVYDVYDLGYRLSFVEGAGVLKQRKQKYCLERAFRLQQNYLSVKFCN